MLQVPRPRIFKRHIFQLAVSREIKLFRYYSNLIVFLFPNRFLSLASSVTFQIVSKSFFYFKDIYMFFMSWVSLHDRLKIWIDFHLGLHYLGTCWNIVLFKKIWKDMKGTQGQPRLRKIIFWIRQSVFYTELKLRQEELRLRSGINNH